MLKILKLKKKNAQYTLACNKYTIGQYNIIKEYLVSRYKMM